MKYTAVSVRQLERKNKPWQARAKYKSPEGKWKEVSKMFPEAKGKKEAQKLANEWLTELNAVADSMPTADKAQTITEVYMDYINKQLATGEIEKSTYKSNFYYFNRYIKPFLGDYIFSSIDRTIVNSWLTKLYTKGFSQNTIRSAYVSLKKVYNYYYNNGDLLKDPFKGVKIPKSGKPKITHLTNEQMDNVLAAVYSTYEPEDAMFAAILLAFYSGMRRGEICGLRWNDIDFYQHTITVRTSIGVGVNGDYTKDPKSKASARTFPMLPQLEEALLQRKAAINPEESWFVIGKQNKFFVPKKFGEKFKAFAEANNLVDAYGKIITPHALRHNFATVGIRANMDISSLSLMLGHASRAITLDVYGDANADAVKTASEKLAEKFNNSTEYFKTEEL